MQGQATIEESQAENKYLVLCPLSHMAYGRGVSRRLLIRKQDLETEIISLIMYEDWRFSRLLVNPVKIVDCREYQAALLRVFGANAVSPADYFFVTRVE